MAAPVKIQEPSEKIVSVPKRIVQNLAYQMSEKSGGYELFKITLDETNKMTKREQVGPPDAWDQIILSLEAELSKQFQ